MESHFPLKALKHARQNVLYKTKPFPGFEKNFEAEILSSFQFLNVDMALKFLSVLAAFASTASAHGYVDNATIGGVFYEVSISTFSHVASSLIGIINRVINHSRTHTMTLYLIESSDLSKEMDPS